MTAVETQKAKSKKISLIVLAFIFVLMLFMAGFMVIVLDRASENTKKYVLEEFSEITTTLTQLSSSESKPQSTVSDIKQINAKLAALPLALSLSPQAVEPMLIIKNIRKRPMYTLLVRDDQNRPLIISIRAMAKRALPKTSKFLAINLVWNRYYSQDGKEFLPLKEPSQEKLASSKLNLVSTNYHNDFHILAMSTLNHHYLANLAETYLGLQKLDQPTPVQ